MNDPLVIPRVNETALFQRLRVRLLRNSLRALLRQSSVRVATILLCCVLIWGSLFVVSLIGFRELVEDWKIFIDGPFFGQIFNMAFVALSVLLMFSTGIILYSSLFNGRETAFLLTTPLRADHVFMYKYQGAVAFSSWAFVLLGSPVVLAYGFYAVRGGAPWYYFALLPLFFLGFVLLPGSAGALVCLAIVNFFPRRKKHILIAAVAVALLAAAWWAYLRLLPSARRILMSVDAISQLLGEFSLLQSPLLPAYWLAEGLRETATGRWQVSLYYLTLIWSNGLFLYVVTAWLAKRLYRRAYNLLISESGKRRRYGTSWLDRLVALPYAFLDRPTRLLIEKDFRTFRRDPAQWAQVLIFVGLAGLYFGSLRWIYSQTLGARFQNGISLLHLAATSFLLCAYTGRFIYPMLSLEGKKFWILGLLPLDRSRLIRSKFAFAAVGTLLAGEFMVLLSDVMLGIGWGFIALHALAIAALALGLSGMSVGMGATMPNFRESDPSKIAVGFGGTLNLVLCLLYQIFVLGLMVLPWHVLAIAQEAEDLSLWSAPAALQLGVVAGLAAGASAVAIPLRAGMKALQRMEF